MRRLCFFFCFLILVGPSATPAQEWRRAPEYEVLLSSYDIEPDVIQLEAGQPVRLTFVNNSNQSHEFSARAFFASAQMRSRDGEAVAGGTVRVGPGETRTVALVPQAGRYNVRGGSLFRRLMGMGGKIIVR